MKIFIANKIAQRIVIMLGILSIICAPILVYNPAFAHADAITAPLNFTLTLQGNQISLAWTDEEGYADTEYTLYRSEHSDWANAVKLDQEMIGVGNGNSSAVDYTVVDDSIVAGVTYSYWLLKKDRSSQPIPFGPFQVTTSHAVYLPLLMR